MNYKITFHLKSPVCFIEKPTFDGLLAWCMMKDKYGHVEQALNVDTIDSFDDMPIIRHDDGYFMASWMMYENDVEFTGSWKKRWANQHDHLVDFGKKKKKVRINAGEFKSYNMPLNLHSLEKVSFYFQSKNIDEVKRLLAYLWGIGKKTSQGYGEIDFFVINAIDYNPFDGNIIRPIPVKNVEELKGRTLSVRLMGFKPPYWLPVNQTFCFDN